MWQRLTLEARITAVALVAVLAGTSLPFLLIELGADTRLAWSGGLLLALPVLLLLLRRVTGPAQLGLKTLEGGLLNFRDGDFSVSLVLDQSDEFSRLAKLYNEVAEILRRERAHIHQRELLLDTVIQSSPQALLLVDQSDHVIYANSSARQLLHKGRPIQGLTLTQLLPHCPGELASAIQSREEGLFSFTDSDGSHTMHVGKSVFVLNAQKHHLILIRDMTRELTRAEVQVWKKVIRLISHELNNSLAPISSMAHSGMMLAQRLDEETGSSDAKSLARVFDTIAERCQHLTEFTQGYARFAKLPPPSCEEVPWQKLLDRISPLQTFSLSGTLPERPGYFDPVQLEQALLNLLKNASESGSTAEDIEVELRSDRSGQKIVVRDRGHGMSEKVLQQALLPFFSTKPQGVGLGLALCREIVEAHGGRLQLRNRDRGGLEVELWLPQKGH
ncbi:ATP-binding protein [Microbulbifer flavimaris]|uniref:histidine kinase n=1 Tax=Microbulbifer flavimaris TaxID=1781068 RepID=A0ABX4HZQ2_9GAMM|nr:histidine kinase [Microbulbifer sp. ZGT114]PCO05546.1 ATP-binding protein [Microbulbifer flavimaris]